MISPRNSRSFVCVLFTIMTHPIHEKKIPVQSFFQVYECADKGIETKFQKNVNNVNNYIHKCVMDVY